MRFRAAERVPNADGDAEDDGDFGLYTPPSEASGEDGGAEQPARRRDAYLQTTLTPEGLQKRLMALQRDARPWRRSRASTSCSSPSASCAGTRATRRKPCARRRSCSSPSCCSATARARAIASPCARTTSPPTCRCRRCCAAPSASRCPRSPTTMPGSRATTSPPCAAPWPRSSAGRSTTTACWPACSRSPSC